jgi:hypothetical protein
LIIEKPTHHHKRDSNIQPNLVLLEEAHFVKKKKNPKTIKLTQQQWQDSIV